MANNSGIIGVAAVLLIAAASGQGGLNSAPRGGVAKAFELGSVLKDLHRMTSIMNRMDNLGQMVLNPPAPPKLPPAGEIFSKAMPDLNGIIENIGPLLAAFGGENENDTF